MSDREAAEAPAGARGAGAPAEVRGGGGRRARRSRAPGSGPAGAWAGLATAALAGYALGRRVRRGSALDHAGAAVQRALGELAALAAGRLARALARAILVGADGGGAQGGGAARGGSGPPAR